MFVLCFCVSLFSQSIYCQISDLTKIDIRKNKFYQDGKILNSKELQSALWKAKNDSVDKLYLKGKNIQTAGTVVMAIGLGVMGVGLVKGDPTGLVTLSGAVIMLVGVVVGLPGAGVKKKAVVKYNTLIN